LAICAPASAALFFFSGEKSIRVEATGTPSYAPGLYEVSPGLYAEAPDPNAAIMAPSTGPTAALGSAPRSVGGMSSASLANVADTSALARYLSHWMAPALFLVVAETDMPVRVNGARLRSLMAPFAGAGTGNVTTLLGSIPFCARNARVNVPPMSKVDLPCAKARSAASMSRLCVPACQYGLICP
jgi:hypothetical protein